MRLKLRLISFIMLVVAVITLISAVLNFEGLFSGMFDDGFQGFADSLFVITQAFAIPLILMMLALIGLRLGDRD